MSFVPSLAHATRIRVRYAETDRMGFAYHANHLIWLEVARTQALEDNGVSYLELEDAGFALPVLVAHCEYHAPTRYGDTVAILLSGRLEDRLRIRFEYQIRRDDRHGALLGSGFTVHVCMDGQGRPRRPHPSLVGFLSEGFSNLGDSPGAEPGSPRSEGCPVGS